MKYYIITLLFVLIFGESIYPQKVEFTTSDWENPAIFEKGQTKPHAFFVPFSSKKAALANDKTSCENFQLLNGVWDFKWVETPDLVPCKFWEPGFNLNDWDKITVPSNWQMEGFGHAKFRNVALTFESDPPNIPDYYNPVGCYKRKFTVPANWKNPTLEIP